MNPFGRQAECAECGQVPINHRLEKMTQTMVLWFDGFLPFRFIYKKLDPLLTRAGERILYSRAFRSFLSLIHKIGILKKKSSSDGETDTRLIALYEGAAATGVTLTHYLLGGTPVCFIAEKDSEERTRVVIFKKIPRPYGFVSPSLEWMDDKGILKEHLREAGIPHADGGTARTHEEALDIFRRLGTAVIVKPHEGSRGRHTTLNIRTEEELKRALDIALEITTRAVVEKYLHGVVHRVTLVDGKPVAIARRQYPHVYGDGTHTVRELVAKENENPLRHTPHFRPIDTEYRVKETLASQGLTIDDVPENGQLVILSDKNSRLHGTVTEDVTDIVHADNLLLFEKLGTVLGDPIVGVDFMIEDMSRPWHEQHDAGVIECNSMPFIDVHHQVVSGRPINVAAYLWDVVFKE